MNRKPEQPQPGKVWSGKLARWVEADPRTPGRRADDELIARRVDAARREKHDAAWIRILFKRHTAEHALGTAFLLKLAQDQLREEANARLDGHGELRAYALKELTGPNPSRVAYALVVLSVVGHAGDLNAVEAYLEHPEGVVRRAAKACRFVLRRRRPEA